MKTALHTGTGAIKLQMKHNSTMAPQPEAELNMTSACLGGWVEEGEITARCQLWFVNEDIMRNSDSSRCRRRLGESDVNKHEGWMGENSILKSEVATTMEEEETQRRTDTHEATRRVKTERNGRFN